jgi:hypothetical protein
MQLDHGAILRKETGHESPKMIRWIVAKPEVIHTAAGISTGKSASRPQYNGHC